MKKFFFVLALMPLCFFACGSDDDDDESISASLEGVWYLKSEKWYEWIDGKADMSEDPYEKIYEDYSTNNVWVITKSDEKYSISEYRNSSKRDTWSQIGNLEYRNHLGTGRDCVKIKSVSEKTMVVELYDGYYGEGYDTGKTSEYGILTFTKKVNSGKE